MSFRVIKLRDGTKMEYKARLSDVLRQAFDYVKIGAAAAGIIASAPVMAQDGNQTTKLTPAQEDGLLIANYLSGDPQGTLEVKAAEIVLEYPVGKSERTVIIEYISLPTQDDRGRGEIRVYFRERCRNSFSLNPLKGDNTLYNTLYKAVDRGSLTSMGQDGDVSGINGFGNVDKGYVGVPGVDGRFMEGSIPEDLHSRDHQETLEAVYASAAAQIRAKSDSARTARTERANRFEVFRPPQSR